MQLPKNYRCAILAIIEWEDPKKQAVIILDLDLQIFSNHKRIVKEIVNVAVHGAVLVPFHLCFGKWAHFLNNFLLSSIKWKHNRIFFFEWTIIHFVMRKIEIRAKWSWLKWNGHIHYKISMRCLFAKYLYSTAHGQILCTDKFNKWIKCVWR